MHFYHSAASLHGKRGNNTQLTGPDAIGVKDFTSALYAKEVLGSFGELLQIVTKGETPRERRQKIVIDAANGVGAVALKSLLKCADECTSGIFSKLFDVDVVHDCVEDITVLNHMCGADFTQKARHPSGETKKWAAANEKPRASCAAGEPQQRREEDEEEEIHYYSLDGDADRVVAFYHDRDAGDDVWWLLDGDRISILYALALRHWVGNEGIKLLDVGVVQTAYANGASTSYIKENLGICVYFSPTGVKNLHPIAHQRDIGAYFESNGHGTVLLNEKAISSKVSSLSPETRQVLSLLPKLVSQVCGDAIADVFACELILLALKMNFRSWVHLYSDVPSTQLKVNVKNPKLITTTPDERRALTPEGLQDAVDEAVSRAMKACPTSAALVRAFARPSGTEPIVRVYTEASDPTVSARLAQDVEKIVVQFCGEP
ncbi:unnamed protein product [Trypanosoma congolense IL3000]|uniref:WGS project CAEQ00000000 data, annotated contig 950 n=1 Tax=Trypanosoma congolense (strain IL3000) TaxID=1068625 RepID=F9WJU2_TRYCI|nr:unnamed protein product [Trypanosoma congolense IL3000]